MMKTTKVCIFGIIFDIMCTGLNWEIDSLHVFWMVMFIVGILALKTSPKSITGYHLHQEAAMHFDVVVMEKHSPCMKCVIRSSVFHQDAGEEKRFL